MVNHGLSTGGLFLIVGLIYERRHTKEIAQFGGLAHVMPVYATFTLIIFLASMGLPLLNGFVGEFMILQGAFAANRVWAYWAVSGVVLGAAYLLWLYQRVFWGKVTHEENQKLAGPERARARDARAARGALLLDRRLPEALPRVPAPARGPRRRDRAASQVRPADRARGDASAGPRPRRRRTGRHRRPSAPLARVLGAVAPTCPAARPVTSYGFGRPRGSVSLFSPPCRRIRAGPHRRPRSQEEAHESGWVVSVCWWSSR